MNKQNKTDSDTDKKLIVDRGLGGGLMCKKVKGIKRCKLINKSL